MKATMRALPLLLLLGAALVGCATQELDRRTIAGLNDVAPDLEEVVIDDSLVKAMTGYSEFLRETPSHSKAPEAMRRLADLQIEKEYGILGDGVGAMLPAPEAAARPSVPVDGSDDAGVQQAGQGELAFQGETDAEFEKRTTAPRRAALLGDRVNLADLPEDSDFDVSGPLQAIATYQKILTEYPWYERNDQVLYQMARAYDELAQPDEAMKVIDRLIEEYPDSRYVDEVYFRRGEYNFVRRKFLDAEEAYLAVVRIGEASTFYELALYKLGWALYKQELYEEALHQYVALLDYKLSTGYDFDATPGEDEEEDERRVADTFRVVSLSFSNLGDADELEKYFGAYGNRSYEDRIYRNLAEFHVTKRRFTDAAKVYDAFVQLNPYHKVAPHFSMRTAEIYAEGNFPLLVVASKVDFAMRYGVNAEYWDYFDIEEHPDVREYLKSNLIDLANHYHALYQVEDMEEERPQNYAEALRWYREFLASFPEDLVSPSINYQLADLLLEHEDFEQSALEYERTAYDYPEHEQAAAAGYAAIFAHRQYLEVVAGAAAMPARRATVDSSLRFAETFPGHEHAAKVLGAATEDLYDMQDFEGAIAAGQWLIDAYPEADANLRRTAWMIVAHSSFDLSRYPDAELAYSRVLELMEPGAEEEQSVIDNLAASIYKQGEEARAAEDYVAAADHFLRIRDAAPTSAIRAGAEYDAAAALIHLEDWERAAGVLEDFRSGYPEHELGDEATRQLAVVYEKSGDLTRSASEYERVADDATDPEMRREAILVAGDLYEQAESEDNALRVYLGYIEEFPRPLDVALEIRFKVAGMYEEHGNQIAYLEQLKAIVEIHESAGEERTDRSRYLAATSSLVLTRPLYSEFTALELTQPFERSLKVKQQQMDVALAAFEALVDYGVGEVTAAATFHMAEIYRNFSDSLLRSERPEGLGGDELEAYELVIEEEAYPFEERALEVHQENVELMRVGVFNDWVQKSLDELAVLMPGRYAKHEISSGFLGTIDQYAYRSPAAPEFQAPALPGETEEVTGAEPVEAEPAETETAETELAGAELAGVDDETLSR